ncbi:MAG TPA: DUF1854 domain-containing protein [Clostridiales bacterium]|jgi:hypothetical protein|nr:DUF1854 domain-containing protein [Clostridiales bacterium]
MQNTNLDIGLLDPSVLTFYINPRGFLALKKGEEDFKRVKLTRALPLTDPDAYIAVSDMSGKEIGILKSLLDLPEEQQKLLQNELSKTYYCPTITQVRSIREKLGYFYFDAKVDEVHRTFAVKDISRSIKQMDDSTVFIADVDGNRYIIRDFAAIHPASRRKLEPYLY